MHFTIYPAIDLRNGRVVRLRQGDPNQQTVFDDDPVRVAHNWVTAGADWLHVVNLDGAFDEAGHANWQILPQLTQTGAAVQFGGGLRQMADVERAMRTGVDRIVLGTAAIEDPELVRQAVQRFGPEHIAVGIDARKGRVKTRGWQTDTAVTPLSLALQMKELGVETIIYTDIARDGVLSGVNAAATGELAQAAGLRVIASGGVASLEDVQRCAALAEQGVRGVIIGRALYDGRIELAEAVTAVGSSSNHKAA